MKSMAGRFPYFFAALSINSDIALAASGASQAVSAGYDFSHKCGDMLGWSCSDIGVSK
jgi:hypothetical protein